MLRHFDSNVRYGVGEDDMVGGQAIGSKRAGLYCSDEDEDKEGASSESRSRDIAVREVNARISSETNSIRCVLLFSSSDERCCKLLLAFVDFVKYVGIVSCRRRLLRKTHGKSDSEDEFEDDHAKRRGQTVKYGSFPGELHQIDIFLQT